MVFPRDPFLNWAKLVHTHSMWKCFKSKITYFHNDIKLHKKIYLPWIALNQFNVFFIKTKCWFLLWGVLYVIAILFICKQPFYWLHVDVWIWLTAQKEKENQDLLTKEESLWHHIPSYKGSESALPFGLIYKKERKRRL